MHATSRWGDSPSSETFRFTTAAEVPFPPENVAVDGNTQRTLALHWSAPDARGAPLKAYHVRVEREKEVRGSIKNVFLYFT